MERILGKYGSSYFLSFNSFDQICCLAKTAYCLVTVCGTVGGFWGENIDIISPKLALVWGKYRLGHDPGLGGAPLVGGTGDSR